MYRIVVYLKVITTFNAEGHNRNRNDFQTNVKRFLNHIYTNRNNNKTIYTTL